MPKCSNLMLTDTIMLCPPVSIVSIPIQFCRFVKISQSLAGFVLSDLVPIRIHLFASDAKWSIKIRTSFSQLQQHILHKNCSVGVCIGLFQNTGATPSQQLTIVETGDVGWAEWLGHASKNCPALNYKIMLRRPKAESVSFYKQIMMMLKTGPRDLISISQYSEY